MQKRNYLVIAAIVALALAALVLSRVLPQAAGMPDGGAPTLEAATDMAATEAAASMAATEAAAPKATLAPAKAYLVASVGGLQYQPIPLGGEGDYTVSQKDIGAVNVIHVTDDSVMMKSSTCDNQDCVKQGVVSLDNMEQRVLFNMIVCLPNRVVLELLTPEEAQRLYDYDAEAQK